MEVLEAKPLLFISAGGHVNCDEAYNVLAAPVRRNVSVLDDVYFNLENDTEKREGGI